MRNTENIENENESFDNEQLEPINNIKVKKNRTVTEAQRQAGIKNLEKARITRMKKVEEKKETFNKLSDLSTYNKIDKLFNYNDNNETQKKNDYTNDNNIIKMMDVMNQNMNKMNERILKIHERYKIKDAIKAEKNKNNNIEIKKTNNDLYSQFASKLLNIK